MFPTSFFLFVCPVCLISETVCDHWTLLCIWGGDVFRAGFISGVCTCGCVVGAFLSTAVLMYNRMDTRSVLWVHTQNIIWQNMSHCTNSRYCSFKLALELAAYT